MSVWIDNLKRALCEKEVVILHGNVRDTYVDWREGIVYGNLVDLLRHSLRVSSGSLSQVVLFDPVDQMQGEVQNPDPVPNESNFSQSDLADSRPMRSTSPEQVELAMVLHEYREKLSDPGSRTALVLPHLDKTIARKSVYQSDDEEHILRLQKLIDEIQPPNRLILVAIQDSMVPLELYTHAPRVRLIAVPLPDKQDRAYYFRHTLTGQVSPDLLDLAADLTDGLYLYDLQNIVATLGQESGASLDSSRIRELVNQYRVGYREDYFGKFPLNKLIAAPKWFTEEAGVKGQGHAVMKVCQALWVARAGLAGESKPKAVFFFAGPSGVGKTFLARSLAEFLFQSKESFIRFDMSEFKEEHTISKLIGSPPGYVGFTEGGALTNAVREKPFSVILFDEVEKAHPRVLDIFLQILDEGRLSDSHGQTVFLSETIIIFTSNIGARSDVEIGPGCSELDRIRGIRTEYTGPELRNKLREHYVAAVERYFVREIARPELLNRIGSNIVAFNYIDTPQVMLQIAEKQIRDTCADFDKRHQQEGWALCFEPNVAESLVHQHKDAIAEFGGRSIGHTIQANIVPELAKSVLLAELRRARDVQFVVSNQENRIKVDMARRSPQMPGTPNGGGKE